MATVTKYTRGAVTGNGWTNAANATAEDNTNYATAAPAKNSRVEGDWDFAAFTDGELPVGSTINSVTIRCNYKVSTTASIASLGVQAGNNGSFDTEETHTTEPLADTNFDVVFNTAPSITDLKTAGRLVARVDGIRGNDNDAVTISLDSVALIVDYTEPDTTDELTANSITTGTPTLTSAAVGQVHALTGSALTSGTPTLTSPVLSEVVALAADNITSGTPTLTSAAVGQVHVLSAGSVTSGTPTLTTAAIGQIHALTADGVTSGTPTLGSPEITTEGDAVAEVVTVKTGTGGIDRKRRIYKPTGLEEPKKKKIEERVEETRQIHAEVLKKLADEISEPEAEFKPIPLMTDAEINREIGFLMKEVQRKRDEEDESAVLLLLMLS